MEVSAPRHIKYLLLRWFCITLMTVVCGSASSQPIRGCTIKDGKMYIMLDRLISERELGEFIERYDLAGIGLWQLVKTKKTRLTGAGRVAGDGAK